MRPGVPSDEIPERAPFIKYLRSQTQGPKGAFVRSEPWYCASRAFRVHANSTMTLRNAPTSMVVKSVYTRAEKIIHPFLFCVYNRLRGGRSSTLSLCDFSISCFDHLKIYCLSSKRWCCNSNRCCSSSAISDFVSKVTVDIKGLICERGTASVNYKRLSDFLPTEV